MSRITRDATTSAINLRDGVEYFFDDAYVAGEEIVLREDFDDPDSPVRDTLTLDRDSDGKWVLG